jgi:hypothetical protein
VSKKDDKEKPLTKEEKEQISKAGKATEKPAPVDPKPED